MKKNKHHDEWEHALNLMTEDELQFILEHPVGYYRSFLDMAWDAKFKIKQYPYCVPDDKAMINAIINILEDLGCECRVNEENELTFIYQGAGFYLKTDDCLDYIVFIDNSWKKVSLKNPDIVNKMKRAINKANICNTVTIAYIEDYEDGVMEIYSTSTIPYYPNYTYLYKYINNKLVDMLSNHHFVDNFLKQDEDESMIQAFPKNNSDLMN